MLKNKKYLLILSFILLFSLFYLVEPMRKKWLYESSQTLRDNWVFFSVTIVLILLFFLYFLIFKKINTIPTKKIVGISMLINLLLWLIWPITSVDIFCYIYQTRVWSFFGENPYLISYSNFDYDIFYNFLNNSLSHRASPYGPLFIIITGFFNLLFKNNILLNLFSLKFFFMILNVLNGYLIYKITKGSKEAFYLYALNPLIIFEFVINGHNDVLFIFLILLSIFFVKNKFCSLKNNLISFFFLALSVLTKFISIIFLPIFALKKIMETNKKIIFLFLLLIIFIIPFMVLYLPFSIKLTEIIKTPLSQSNFPGNFKSPLIIIISAIVYLLNHPINIALITLFSRIIFVIFYLIILISIIKQRTALKNDQNNYHLIWLFGLVLLIFYLTSVSWLMPWYFPLLITLFIIILSEMPEKRYFSLLVIFGFTFYGIINYLVLR